MGFRTSWTAEVLAGTPMIAPARSYVWPMRIAGEEEALARGAVNVMVRPRTGGNYLVTAALGFKDPSVPTGVFGCPNEDEICVVAGGYAYLAKADEPEAVTLLAMKPVVEVREAAEAGLLLFVGFHTVLAWGSEGPAWETGRLSWEGVRVTTVTDEAVEGFGWDLMRDVEVAFRVDLRTGVHEGGGWKNKS